MQYLKRWIPVCAMMGIIFVFSSFPADQLPYFSWADLLLKKGGHMFGYALLGLAWLWALAGNGEAARWRRLAWILTVLYALSDEWHQSFVPGRHASLLDVGIDGLGAGLALGPFWAWLRARYPQIF